MKKACACLHIGIRAIIQWYETMFEFYETQISNCTRMKIFSDNIWHEASNFTATEKISGGRLLLWGHIPMLHSRGNCGLSDTCRFRSIVLATSDSEIIGGSWRVPLWEVKRRIEYPRLSNTVSSLGISLCFFCLWFKPLDNVWQTLICPFSTVSTPIFANE